MQSSQTPWWKTLFFITELFIGINITILDIYLFHILTHPNTQPVAATQQETIHTPVSSASALLTLPTATPTPTPAVKTVAIQPTVKEYFVPFGSGQGTNTDWVSVPGLQAYVDSTSYPNIRQVTLEATVRVPTANQNVQLRLFDITDGHPVWYSDISFSGSADAQFAESQRITLDTGAKTYVVQMKTQLGSQAFIDQARLHITLN